MVLYGTATASTLLEFKASLLSPCPSFGSRPVNPLIQPVKNTIFFPAIKHVSSNSPSQQFKKISNTFVASASTAEVDTLVEKLPADLNVTETEEPNSRVSNLVRLFFLLTASLISVKGENFISLFRTSHTHVFLVFNF